ncbi:MAG TPA: hypothetical protein DD454_00595 [Candidatus Moranbacteria bacterium]|nr:hypothetical protein [Candidatus Moranbacteria bacterium]
MGQVPSYFSKGPTFFQKNERGGYVGLFLQGKINKAYVISEIAESRADIPISLHHAQFLDHVHFFMCGDE